MGSIPGFKFRDLYVVWIDEIILGVSKILFQSDAES